MKLGARIIKTGIAITLAIYISTLLGFESPSFAGIAATFAVQPSIYRSYQTILEQMQSNFIGAFFAILFVLSFGPDPIVIGLVSIIVILINLKLKIETTIPLALVTVIAIMESPDENFIAFALMRFANIMIGVFASFLINLVFIPPKYETKLYYKIVDNTKDILQWTRVLTRNASEHTVLKNDLERIKEVMIKIDNLYLLYKEERNYLRKKKQHVKGRKLVLFRQMILTTNVAFETLKKLHKLENELHQLPKSFQIEYQAVLDHAVTYHEQILFKYVGKIRSGVSLETILEVETKTQNLTDTFLELNQKETHGITRNHLLLLVSIIIEYCEQLEHLDKLIESFQTYHKEDNEVNINDKE